MNRLFKYDTLPPEHKTALDKAEKVMENAYNPYSRFYVGACLVSEDGQFVTGANFENSAYGSTICAERAAVLHANALGIRQLKAIAIIIRGENFDSEEPSASCGSCRQVLYEAAQLSKSGNMQIILSNTKKDKIIVTTIRDLLPMAFGPLDLEIDVERYR